ncbi:MAG: D-alanyl-D-alanine carboxypeptidase/D-alanyl-D-alanine-endopeptidase [Mangrovibacterium sp.]
MKGSVIKILVLLLMLGYKLCAYGTKPADSLIYSWAGRECLVNASVGVYLQDALTGQILGSCHAQQSLIPASTLKLITTAAALEMLGPDYRFQTRLAFRGQLSNDSLKGDLIIIGGGDPALGSMFFRDYYLNPHFLKGWTDSLHQHKIRHVCGQILTDATIYDERAVPGTWIWEDIGNYYGAGVSGLSVYDNSCEIRLRSPGEQGRPVQIISVSPEETGLEFDNRLRSSEDKRDLACVYGSPPDHRRIIRGTIPLGRNSFVIRASVPDPPQLLARQLKNMLEASGISVTGSTGRLNVPVQKEVTLATTFSPPLIKLIRVINYQSVNLFAEHLLRQLAYTQTGNGSLEEGIRVLTNFWENRGINTSGLFICDGSGLSRFNALTAEQLVQVLAYMKNKSPHSELFYNTLPAVPDGTLYSFDQHLFPRHSLQAKSGSMTRVRCYAGILTTTSGRQIIFAVLLNNFSCSQHQAILSIEELLAELHGL